MWFMYEYTENEITELNRSYDTRLSEEEKKKIFIFQEERLQNIEKNALFIILDKEKLKKYYGRKNDARSKTN